METGLNKGHAKVFFKSNDSKDKAIEIKELMMDYEKVITILKKKIIDTRSEFNHSFF